MKIGRNIADIREAKGYSQQTISERLNIDREQYNAIENDTVEITLSQLDEIAKILSCSPVYIIKYKESSGSIYNHFDNNGNAGTNIHVQGIDPEQIQKVYERIYSKELDRIVKFEKLLREKNIDFDF